MQPTTTDRARSFDAWAPEYDRYRPGYPDALFDQIAGELLLPAVPLVVDLGAGTGRATRAMAGRGWRVTAVEPGKPMLDVLRARATDDGLLVATVQASAEETGLDPSSVDLATAAQAFHWFDQARALTEMSRIVRPGGGIALFWNVRDADASPLLAGYNALLKAHGVENDIFEPGPDQRVRDAIAHSGGFAEPRFTQVRHEIDMSAEAFIGLAFTASYVRAMEPAGLTSFRTGLEALVARLAPPQRGFAVPYVVDCWIARRRGR